MSFLEHLCYRVGIQHHGSSQIVSVLRVNLPESLAATPCATLEGHYTRALEVFASRHAILRSHVEDSTGTFVPDLSTNAESLPFSFAAAGTSWKSMAE